GDSRGLITRPTLVWKVNASSGGERLVRTTYQTAGITWRADYNLVLDAKDTSADLGAWVSLLNLSGAAYENAQLKLIAGDVQRIQPQPVRRFRGGAAVERMAGADGGFEEKSFFEYHLYTLPRRTDVKANATQQITLFPTARNVPVRKVLVYDPTAMFAEWGLIGNWGDEPNRDQSSGLTDERKVDVFVRFQNDEESNLGMPLPKGKVRVYKQDDTDGTLEFVGEGLIDHTPRNEKVSVRVGQSFDVVGERTQTSFAVSIGHGTIDESYKIEIRNRKREPVTVVVRERLFRWMNWEIVQHSDAFRKVDAQTIEWELTLPPDGVRAVTYAVRYVW
ncbi:MAG: DUF4139 domain-containing protein, partial [Phycisphaerales bacterium]|nr:DUF4139 domain-containing protein [Phycisphaerales bacterium]